MPLSSAFSIRGQASGAASSALSAAALAGAQAEPSSAHLSLLAERALAPDDQSLARRRLPGQAIVAVCLE
jgi:hypothetical protein